MFGFLKKIFGTAQQRLLNKYWKIVDQVSEWEKTFSSLSDDELKQKTEAFKQRARDGEPLDNLLPEAYAVVKVACSRLCGTEFHVSGYDQKWDMVPYDVQVLGAIAMHFGSISEMQTGEGKTLTASMPLYLNALSGKPVHLVTVNDYLARRDCEWVGAIFRFLGLNANPLTNDTPLHERKQIYSSDIVYGTASEFGFDYLRDNSMAMHKEEQVQRGHFFAIVDEIDSILIDEARTPLIISGPVPQSRQMYQDLKDGVKEIVRIQRDLCNKFATDARNTLKKFGILDSPEKISQKRSKEDEQEFQKAIKNLWLVGKGIPKHKIYKRMLETPEFREAIDNMDLFYYNDQNKEAKAAALSELVIIVSEKANDFELTDKGIDTWVEAAKAQQATHDDFVMLDLSHEYLKIDEDFSLAEEEKTKQKAVIRDEDARRKERAHNMRQLLRAHLMMEKDVDYIIQDNKIIIIDENTGRPQPGRRFSDGLHQAIEAKEGVEIQKETQTYATVTLQNYFRMYNKLAGMTGTAITEAGEFKEIYKLEVLEIPTHKSCIRKDANDEIYMTEREKYHAILKEVKELHEQGRPILLGTESVEVSEKLARIFTSNRLPHKVLNAKNHAKEAEIIAEAGQKGAITIATNMAGRGTDIKLGQGIATLGGLHVIGSTRHQSRRIDRQLRGRCARQGDPGTSKFYVSFEDSLLRMFTSPKMTALLKRFRPPEGEPISAKMINRSLETAQKRVEQKHFMIRKHTLEYDNVMEKQRNEIYSFRNDILHTANINELAEDLLHAVVEELAPNYFEYRGSEEGWNPEGYRHELLEAFPLDLPEGIFDKDNLDLEAIIQLSSDKLIGAFRSKIEFENKKTKEIIAQRSDQPPIEKDYAAEAIRNLMVRKTDQLWQEHLLSMDHLREEVSMRQVGQKDPLMEFKHDAFMLFEKLSHQMKKAIAKTFFKFEVVPYSPEELQQIMARLNEQPEAKR